MEPYHRVFSRLTATQAATSSFVVIMSLSPNSFFRLDLEPRCNGEDPLTIVIPEIKNYKLTPIHVIYKS